MPHQNDSTLSRILSLLIDDIGSEKKVVREEWPALADVEGAYVEKVLRHTQGNKQAAARLLNIDRKTLDRMIRRHNLSLSEMQTET